MSFGTPAAERNPGTNPVNPMRDFSPTLVAEAFDSTFRADYSAMSRQVDFTNTRIAFNGVSNGDLLVREVFFSFLANPTLARIGQRAVIRAVQKHNPLAEKFVRKTAYPLFCGGESLEEALKTARRLSRFGQGAIIDYAVEGAHDEKSFDAACQETIRAVDVASRNRREIPFVALKVTGLVEYEILAAAQQQPGGPERLSGLSVRSKYESASRRLESIAAEAEKKGVFVFIDAEEVEIQGAIDEMAMTLMRRHNKTLPIIQTAVQEYRVDRLKFLTDLIRTAKDEGFYVGLKIVRGAYMKKEREMAQARGYQDPIHDSKEGTDRDFDAAVRLCLDNIDRVMLCVATHNEMSCFATLEGMRTRRIAASDPRVWFAQLLGMSDHISANLVAGGYNVCKYLPYGPWDITFPYLTRRIVENSGEFGKKGTRESQIVRKERSRRMHEGVFQDPCGL